MALECGIDLKTVSSLAEVQLPMLNHAHTRPASCVSQRGLGDSFTGFRPVESTHSGEAFNPCPLPAPSLHSSPLYMDMFYFHSSFLLVALSAAQQGTDSLFNRYLFGQWEKSHFFFSKPHSLPLSSSCPALLVSNAQASIYYSYFPSLLLGYPSTPCPPLKLTAVRRMGEKHHF